MTARGVRSSTEPESQPARLPSESRQSIAVDHRSAPRRDLSNADRPAAVIEANKDGESRCIELMAQQNA